MFKSIEYRLRLYLFLLILSVAGAVFYIVHEIYIYSGFFLFLLFVSLRQLYINYNKFNKNILFLLNALDNGDYSFKFTEAKLSRRERELNQMMNRIKDILTKARQETIENEKFTSLVIESVPTGIIILDENNRVRMTNRAVNKLLGLPVFTHINQLKVLDESYPQLFRELKYDDHVQIKIINERETVQLSLRLSGIGLKNKNFKVITLNSIGNELEAKEMESWIRLIKVMTHEIMNSIAPITSLTDTLLFSYKTLPPDNMSGEELRQNTIEAFETINRTAGELISFVQSYRKFTGIPTPEKSMIPLKRVLDHVLSLEKQQLDENNITIEIIPENISLSVNINEAQIIQVLVNLIKNAVEAMNNHDNGKIRIVVSEKNGRVYVDVCNNGNPIPEDIVPNIFIPFFTTKDTGTGIGLSISRYIMRLHGGNLKYYTANDWTVFSMIFQPS
ncbi:MAG: ATP-binding protein [Candidatus Azobacteroides sp.]|nr:ATP-binding protein [Candidatus Azobacteroides sp.]